MIVGVNNDRSFVLLFRRKFTSFLNFPIYSCLVERKGRGGFVFDCLCVEERTGYPVTVGSYLPPVDHDPSLTSDGTDVGGR